jgi:hypothetical protein
MTTIPAAFDELTVAWATGLSRRRAIRRMAGGLVGAALAAAHLTRAGAAAEAPGAICSPPCRTGLTCCGVRCVNLLTNRHHCGSCGNHCPPGFFCCSGQCC